MVGAYGRGRQKKQNEKVREMQRRGQEVDDKSDDMKEGRREDGK